MPLVEFQEIFKANQEATLLDTGLLNYTIWKCLAQSNYLSSFLGVLVSLPITYGFTNDYWTKMSDFMIKQKPGVRQIHTLQIIGKVAAELNTSLSYLIGKKAARNFEIFNLCTKQHGSRSNMLSVDVAMLKLLTL